MAITKGQLTVSWKDYSDEPSSLQVAIPEITAVNFAARVAEIDAFIDALEDVCDGSMQYGSYGNKKQFAIDASTVPTSRRETKLLILFQDDTAMKRGSFEIPTFNASAVTFLPNSDFVKMDDAGVAAALKTAIEELIQSPWGNDVTVYAMQSVGRNL